MLQKAVTTFKEFELSVGQLSLQCLLIIKRGNAIVAPAADEDRHGQAGQAIIGIMINAGEDLERAT